MITPERSQTYQNGLCALATQLETRLMNEKLGEYGVRFTEEPIRDIGSIAWMLTLQRGRFRTDRFVVVEENNVSRPGCGYRPERTAYVDRLVVALRQDVMEVAREAHPEGVWGRRHRLFLGDDLTAYAFIRSAADTTRLFQGLDQDKAAIQEMAEERLYQGSRLQEGQPPAMVQGDNLDEYYGLKSLLTAVTIMRGHEVIDDVAIQPVPVLD